MKYWNTEVRRLSTDVRKAWKVCATASLESNSEDASPQLSPMPYMAEMAEFLSEDPKDVAQENTAQIHQSEL